MSMRITTLLLAGSIALGDTTATAATSPVAVDRDRDLMRPAEPAAPAPAPARLAATPVASRAPSGNPLWAIPLRRLSATRERPLFAPSRRPPPPVVANSRPTAAPSAPSPSPAAARPAEPDKPRLALVGTVTGMSAEGIGLFLDQNAKNVVRLKTGEDHNGWVLRTVQRGEVVLAKGRQTTVLTLPPPQMSAAASSPVQNAPAPPLVTPANRATEAIEKQGPAKVGSDITGGIRPPEVERVAVPSQPGGGPPPELAAVLFQQPQFKPPPPQANPFRQSWPPQAPPQDQRN